MGGFSKEALEKGIQKCKDNIKIFEDAIQKEQDTIREYRRQIGVIEEKEFLANNPVLKVEVEKDGD